MKNTLIKQITEEHIEGYRAALDSVAREDKYLAHTEAPPFTDSCNFVLNNLENNYPHIIALNDEQVIGWCDITSSKRAAFSHIGNLGMGIITDFRGQGIGEALIVAALDKARINGLIRIQLSVREDNLAAFKLYEKVGFLKEGFQPNGQRTSTGYSNLICMGLLF